MKTYFEHNEQKPQLDVVEFTAHAPELSLSVVEALTDTQRALFRQLYNASIDARLQIPAEAA